MRKEKALFSIIIIIISSLFFSTNSKELLEVKADPMGVQLEWAFLTGGDVKSSPAVADSDDDGYSDGDEILAGSDPLDFNDIPTEVQETSISGYFITTVLFCLYIILYKKRRKLMKTTNSI